MANTLGTTSATVIAQSFLDAFQLEAAPLNIFTTDFSSEIAQKGSAVVTRVPTALTAATKDVSGSFSSSDVTLTDVTCTLSTWKYVQFALSELDMAKSMVTIEDTFIKPAATALAFAIEDAAFALIKNAAYSNSVVASAGAFDYAKLVDLEAATDGLGYTSKKAVVLPSTYIATLRKDAAVRDSLNNSVNQATETGAIGKLAGFDVIKSNRVPANSENLAGFAADKRGMVIATRILPLSDAPGVAMSVQSLPNGLSVRHTKYYDVAAGNYVFRWDLVYGVAVASGTGIYRIKSA